MDISKHAKERYAERIMSYEDKCDVNKFVQTNEAKIVEDLNKMVKYGELLYSGKSLKENSSVVDIFLKDSWVLLVDKNKDLLITVYKIDLQVEEEFTKEYIERLKNKLNTQKEEYNKEKESANKQINEYREIISSNQAVINDYKKTMRSLEEQNELYNKLILDLNANTKVLDDNIRKTVMILTGNKTW